MAGKPFDEGEANLIKWIKEIGNGDISSNDLETQLNTTIDFESSSRCWTYQYCIEMGYLQTRDKSHYMRSGVIDLNYWRTKCELVFGKDFVPNVTATNIELGGLNLSGSNILFTNGVEDGWKWCGVLELPKDSPM